ncbi:hypothetical protein BGW80DRAFT_1366088 [Lactifluus volemus]|nr:hypothetical protein BGW80DRAFT_1366088 [Lactifluus volemus]
MMSSLRFVARDGYRATVVLAGCDVTYLQRVADSPASPCNVTLMNGSWDNCQRLKLASFTG